MVFLFCPTEVFGCFNGIIFKAAVACYYHVFLFFRTSGDKENVYYFHSSLPAYEIILKKVADIHRHDAEGH